VALVLRVPVAVVDEVGVPLVRNRDVPAALAVLVLVPFVHLVAGLSALVHVALVHAVDVALVDEVGVPVVRDRDMAAALAVNVRVVGVHLVLGRRGHRKLSLSPVDGRAPRPPTRIRTSTVRTTRREISI
jgi:hypothetical protein